MSMTPTEILHDALQQCIDANKNEKYNISFEYAAHVNWYTVWAFEKGDMACKIAWIKQGVELNEDAHKEAMQALSEFLEGSEFIE